MKTIYKLTRGFTLVEMVVSMTLGLLVFLAMTQLFKASIDASFVISQRAENQQNLRSAINLIAKDVSMAGAGLPAGGIQLPINGGATPSHFGRDQAGMNYVTPNTYPANWMFGIVPGYSTGVQGGTSIPAAPAPSRNDSITVAYVDYAFPLFQYKCPNLPAVCFALPTINLIKDPNYAPAPPDLNSAGGLQVGDVIMLSNNVGTAVAEVTGLTATTISIAGLDPLNLNQNAAAISNNVTSISGGANTQFYRLFVVTYFIQVPANGDTPRLMRQVNGLAPQPVADNIINLQFAYDIYNTNTSSINPNEPNPLGLGLSLNLVQKVNVAVMGASMVTAGKKSQAFSLATSVSARNMSYVNRYD